MPNRSALLVFVFLAGIAVASAGCDIDGDGGGGGSGGDPGESSGTLRVIATATCALAVDEGGEDTCPLFYYVSVEYDDGEDEVDVDDAIVEIGPPGNTMILASSGNGSYSGSGEGWGDSFAVDVTRGEDYLTGAVIRAPNAFALSLDPDPPHLDEAAQLSWSPGDGGAHSLVSVYSFVAGLTYDSGIENDDGSKTLPATAFPDPASYRIDVGRATTLQLAGPFSSGTIVFGRAKMVTIE